MPAVNYPSDFEVVPVTRTSSPPIPQVESITSETLPMLESCAQLVADTHRNEDMQMLARLIVRLCEHIRYKDILHREYKQAVFSSYVPEQTSRA